MWPIALAALAQDRASPTVGRLIHLPGTAVWLMEHEVTQAEWRAVMGAEPSLFADCDRCPVESVTWTDAVAFARALSAREGEAFRLPTEEEWRIAAGPAAWAGGPVGEVGWYADNSGARTHAVCEKRRTALGFCDLTGNVWEWTATEEGGSRVLLGGGWFDSAEFARVENRLISAPGNRHGYLGFRLALVDPVR
jgi:formylglycine-generating enzyme